MGHRIYAFGMAVLFTIHLTQQSFSAETNLAALNSTLQYANLIEVPVHSTGYFKYIQSNLSQPYNNHVISLSAMPVQSHFPEKAGVSNHRWENVPLPAYTMIALLMLSIAVAVYMFIFLPRLRAKDKEPSETEVQLYMTEKLLAKDEIMRKMRDSLERIISTSPLCCVMFTGYEVINCNIYMWENFGMKPGDDIRSYHCDGALLDKHLALASSYGFVTNEIIRLNMPDGMTHRFLSNLTTVDFENELMYILWAVDIEDSETKKDQLQLARQSLQTVLDALPTPLRISNPDDYSIIYANKSGAELFEVNSPEAIYGSTFRDFLPELQSDGISSEEKIRRFFENGDRSIELECVTAKGKKIDVRTTLSSIDYNGKRATLGIMKNLADERERQMVYRSLQLVLDALPVAIQIVDVETMEISYANNKCVDMFECDSVDELIGHSVLEFLPEFQSNGASSRRKVEKMMGVSKLAGAALEHITANANLLDAQITAFKINYKGRVSMVGIIRDLAVEKAYEQSLLNAAEREREANQLKSRFLVNMSHEIRTPMNAIIGLTEIELRKNPSRDAREIYKKINDSAKHLLQIINDILDLSKIEANKIELIVEEFELEDVLNSALLVVTPRLEGKDVELLLKASPKLPRFVMGDRTRVWQILKNFLDNSAKYTDDGHIMLDVRPDEINSNDDLAFVTFTVEDTGIGMSDEHQSRLFMPYEQFYNEAQKKYSGTGLGMVISKQFCEIMNGDMQITSVQGVGTTIRFTLPFRRTENRELLSTSESRLTGKILAVDDDAISLDIMASILKESGADCLTARSGREAIDIILKHRDEGLSFDVILLDYKMPGLNGLETARRIQESLSRSPKLLMVTAYQRELLKNELDDCGFADLIEKPIIPTRFVQRMREALGGGEAPVAEDRLVQFRDVRLLLCEDNPLNQEVASGMFACFGVTPVIAGNGREGLERLREGEAFDLIFMDLQMPVMDGYEATRSIRAEARYDKVPIISLTADAMTEITDRCLEAGMNDHLSKPIDFDKLQEIFLKWLPESKRAGTSGATVGADETKALARFGGKRDLYERALREFAKSLPAEWQDFDSAVREREQTLSYLHSLKGVSGNLGIDDIYECTRGLEASMRNNAPDRGLYERLVRLCGEMKNNTAQADAPAPKGSDEELMAHLKELEAALRDYDPLASAEIVYKMQEKEYSSVSRLYELALGYEFDEALTELSELLKSL